MSGARVDISIRSPREARADTPDKARLWRLAFGQTRRNADFVWLAGSDNLMDQLSISCHDVIFYRGKIENNTHTLRGQ